MDYHRKTLRAYFIFTAILGLFPASTVFATAQYSYGRTFNYNIGSTTEKIWTVGEIFVPKSGKLLDVDIAINITHTSICDLQIFLTSPGGTTAILNKYDVYDFKTSQQDYNWTVFDDQAGTSIRDAKAPFTGLCRPKNDGTLSIFNGQNPYGIWQVKIYDWVYGDVGVFVDGRLDLLINPEPSTIALLIGCIAFARVIYRK